MTKRFYVDASKRTEPKAQLVDYGTAVIDAITTITLYTTAVTAEALRAKID